MSGLNFIHPGFLVAGLLTVALPILIHLLFRQKPRTVDLGTLQFLRVVLKDQVRRRKVRRWLLLALRVVGALLLAFLFARPYWTGFGSEGRNREVAVVIDRSASMAAKVGGTSCFARALEAAESVLKTLPDQTIVHLAYADASAVEPVKNLRVDRSLKPGFALGDHAKALGWARDLMVVSKRTDRMVYYVTDLQRSNLDASPVAGWPEGVRVEVIDAGRPVARNLAVSGVSIDRTDIRPGDPLVVSAIVTNTGAMRVRDVRVGLDLPPRSSSSGPFQTISLEPSASRSLAFPVEGLKPGSYQGSIFLDSKPPDDFSEDDRHWFAFEARAVERVLVVDGEPGPSVFSNETYYLETALRLKPPGQGASATPFDTVRVARDGRTVLPDLRGFSVVIACNVGAWSENEASLLREHVIAGGKLVIFGGRNVTEESADRLRRARLLPAEVLGPSEPGAYRIGTWDHKHPMFRALSDPQQGDIRRLEFRRITRLKPDPEATVLARALTGEPLVLEATLGTGKLVVFAMAADRDWSEWPVNRLFLPMIHQVVGDLTGRLPDDASIRVLTASTLAAPGVTRSDRLAEVRNLDPKELEPDRLTPEEFARVCRLPASKPPSRESLVVGSPEAQRADEVWRYLIWGLFVVLLAETFLANRTHA